MLQLILDSLQQDRDVMMAWVQFIPLIISAASAAYGAVKQGKANRERKKMVGQYQADNQALFNQDYYSDYTQSAEAQNIIRQMRGQFDRQAQREAHTAAITGATVESQAAGKEGRNRAMGNLMGNLGAMGTQRKERTKDRYIAGKNQAFGLNYDWLNERSGSAGNMMQNGMQGMANTDWASIMGGNKPYWQSMSPSTGANISSPSTAATVQGSAKTTGVIPAYKNPFT